MAARHDQQLPAGPRDVQTSHIGPAFAALNPRRQTFVMGYVNRGKRNATQAYIDAGYNCKSREVAQVNACVLLHNDKVQAAIQEYCVKQLISLGPIATEVAAEMIENPQTDPATRSKLVLAVWDRTGMAAKTEHTVKVEHLAGDPQMIAEARRLVAQAGLTPDQARALLGRSMAEAIDVPFTDITPEPGGEGTPDDPAEGEAEQAAVPQEEEFRW